MSKKSKIIEVPTSAWQMLPPAPHLCQVCAVKHGPEEPHNPQSLFYQVAFRIKHGRDATWADALAHCTPEMQRDWMELLAERGITVHPTPERSA